MTEHRKIDPRGHRASSPWQMPKQAWKDIAARTYKRTWDDNVGLVASGVAFYSFFALLSLLGLVVLVYGFVADPQAAVHDINLMTKVLPDDVATLIGQQLITSVESSKATKGVGIFVAAAVALYGGTNGAASMLTALNIAYEEKEKRSLLRFYLIAFAMTVTALMLALGALAATAGVAYLQHFVPQTSPGLVLVGDIVGYIVLIFVGAGVAATLYRFGPSREDARWRWITPGSMVAALAWVLLTVAFSFYVATFTNYRASYGPLGAVVALLTWLYLSAYAFVFGAELNSEIEHQTAIDSTTGSPQPIGKRGAWAADNVAKDDRVEDRPEETREGEKLTRSAPQVAEEEHEKPRRKSSRD